MHRAGRLGMAASLVGVSVECASAGIQQVNPSTEEFAGFDSYAYPMSKRSVVSLTKLMAGQLGRYNSRRRRVG